MPAVCTDSLAPSTNCRENDCIYFNVIKQVSWRNSALTRIYGTGRILYLTQTSSGSSKVFSVAPESLVSVCLIKTSVGVGGIS